MSTLTAGAVFAAATAVVLATAAPMARVSDHLASRTALGSALFGAIFLGASTSLPGIVVTVSAALRGQGELAAANALGGIAAQTMFLALADVVSARGALQRTAVSRKVMAELALVVGLLSLALVGLGTPRAVAGVHVVTPLLVVGYLTGMVVVRSQPGREDDSDEHEASSTDTPRSASHQGQAGDTASRGSLWRRYALLALLLAAAGASLGFAVEPLASAAGMSLTAAGAVLTALATSTPEMMTAVSAARRDALSLAIGDIAGGNAFDVLFLAAADVAALGALYATLSRTHVLLAGVALLLNAVLLVGFIRRGRGVRGRVAVESLLVIGVYGVVCAGILVA